MGVEGALVRTESLQPAALPTSGIDMVVRRGESVGIWGAAGSGKTALLRALAGLERPAGGRLFWNERDITRWRPQRRRQQGAAAGLVLADPYRLFEGDLSIGKLLDAYRLDRQRFKALSQSSELLSALSDQRIGSLSGTWRARLAILCAVVNEPSVVLIDDVWRMLAPESWDALWAEFGAWTSQARSLIAASRWWQALRDVDTLIVLRDGEIVEWGAREAVLSDPRHPYTQALRDTAPGSSQQPQEAAQPRSAGSKAVQLSPGHWVVISGPS